MAKLQTSGIDITANYNHKIKDYGSLNLNVIGTYLKEFVIEPIPGLGEYDCAGFFGATCGTPLPEWRHKAPRHVEHPVERRPGADLALHRAR